MEDENKILSDVQKEQINPEGDEQNKVLFEEQPDGAKQDQSSKIFSNLNGEYDTAENRESQLMIKNLYIIGQNSGIVLGDQADLHNVEFSPEPLKGREPDSDFSYDDCIVKDESTLVAWLTKHYNDFEMAFLISLAVFERTPYLWIYEMTDNLFYMMEGNQNESKADKLAVPDRQRMKTAGAKKYYGVLYNHMGRVESEFICFQKPEYAKRILRCIWMEFVFFRETLIKWLSGYICDKNCTKIIMATEALAKLAELDFEYFNRVVIKVFFARKNFGVDFSVSQIMGRAYETERYRENINKLFVYWCRERNIHYSFAALMLSVNNEWGQERVQMAVEGYINNLLRETQGDIRGEYREYLPTFYEIGARRAVYFKSIVMVLYDKLQKYSDRRFRLEKSMVGLIFFWLLEIDYLQSDINVNRKKQNKEMIFVKMCLIRNDIAPQIQELWRYIWKDREFHRFTKIFLEKYLYQYGGCDQNDIDYLQQFLNSFQESDADRKNMEFFLRKISLKSRRPVRAAGRINNKL